MELLRQVGVYVPFLLYIWLAAACIVGYIRTRRSALLNHVLTLLIFSLGHGFRTWAQLSRMPDSRPLHKFNGHTKTVYSVAFSPDSAVLATGATDGTLRLWKTSDGTPLRTISLADLKDGFDTIVAAIAFRHDGKLITTGSSGSGEPAAVRLWGISGSSPVKTWAAGGENIAFSPDGKLLASASGWTVYLWRVPR